jgi:hypothetical protein
MSSELTLPTPDNDDSDDVRWALETAQTLWKQGDKSGSLRWLSRASEMAAHEDADMRALELAKVAAELRSTLDLPNSLPPPVPAGAEPEAEPSVVPPEPPTVPLVKEASADPQQKVETKQAAPAPPASAAKEPDVQEAAPDSSRRARSSEGGMTRYIGVRVAVGGLDNSGGLQVRRLAEGELTRHGESLAVLVSLDPGVDLTLL